MTKASAIKGSTSEQENCPVCNAGTEILYRLREVEERVENHETEVDTRIDKLCEKFESIIEKQGIAFNNQFKETWGIITKIYYAAISLLVSVVLLLLAGIVAYILR